MSLEKTKVYQKAKAERREEILKAAVPLLLKTEMSVKQIAQQLNNVNVEAVRLAVQESA